MTAARHETGLDWTTLFGRSIDLLFVTKYPLRVRNMVMVEATLLLTRVNMDIERYQERKIKLMKKSSPKWQI